MRINPQLMEKIKESLSSVLPITAIVLLLSVTIAPLTPGAIVLFLFGALLLIGGIGVFTLGVDMSMTPMGQGIGVSLSRSKHMALPVLLCFVLGALITVAEPDLQVLAEQIPAVPNMTLILTVAVGVGIFLVIALLRVKRRIPLSYLLVGFYILVFALSLFVPEDFIPAAFDSGGVTTGPITVPFIMALGVGMASVRSDKNATSNSFGLVALCSIGPILSVMILGICYTPDSAEYSSVSLADIATTRDAAQGGLDPVTGREAAKMLLAMAGYESEAAGFVGAGWAQAVDEKAEELGLYQGQAEGAEDESLDREHAALMVYHALDLDLVSYWEQVERPDGSGWDNHRLETPKKWGETVKEWSFGL